EAEILEAVCFNKCTTCVVSVDELEQHAFEAYPNPFYGSLTVNFQSNPMAAQLTVTDLSGREVIQEQIAPGTGVVVFETSSLPAGSYVVQVTRKGVSQGRMFIKY
ncbi:MAG TPA: hypothetical protein DDZ19_07795, partial [Flavobacteriales bacterium]|nr:hypothetical protein [Flavobacteriales bacterium]